MLAGGILARAFGVPVHASRTGEASERQMVGELNIMPAFTWWRLLIPKHGRGILDRMQYLRTRMVVSSRLPEESIRLLVQSLDLIRTYTPVEMLRSVLLTPGFKTDELWRYERLHTTVAKYGKCG